MTFSCQCRGRCGNLVFSGLFCFPLFLLDIFSFFALRQQPCRRKVGVTIWSGKTFSPQKDVCAESTRLAILCDPAVLCLRLRFFEGFLGGHSSGTAFCVLAALSLRFLLFYFSSVFFGALLKPPGWTSSTDARCRRNEPHTTFSEPWVPDAIKFCAAGLRNKPPSGLQHMRAESRRRQLRHNAAAHCSITLHIQPNKSSSATSLSCRNQNDG